MHTDPIMPAPIERSYKDFRKAQRIAKILRVTLQASMIDPQSTVIGNCMPLLEEEIQTNC